MSEAATRFTWIMATLPPDFVMLAAMLCVAAWESA